MSKVNRVINAAIGATMDRRFISKAAKGKIPADEINYSKILVDISGPSANNFKDSCARWHKAYLSNLSRIKLIEEVNAPFKQDNSAIRFIKNIIQSIKNKI